MTLLGQRLLKINAPDKTINYRTVAMIVILISATLLVSKTVRAIEGTIKSQVFEQTETAYFYTRPTMDGETHFYLPKLNISLKLIMDRDGKQLWNATASFNRLSDREKSRIKQKIPGWKMQPVHRDGVYAVGNCQFLLDSEGQIKAKLKYETTGMTFNQQEELCSFGVLIKKTQENILALKKSAENLDLISFGLERKVIEVQKNPIKVDVERIYRNLSANYTLGSGFLSEKKSVFLIGVEVAGQLNVEQINDIIDSQDPLITTIQNHLFESEGHERILKKSDQIDSEIIVRLELRDLHEINL